MKYNVVVTIKINDNEVVRNLSYDVGDEDKMVERIAQHAGEITETILETIAE